MPPAIRTVCLEFFGPARDRRRRSSRSSAISTRSAGRRESLAGLEHLDERYVQGGRLRDQGEARPGCRRWCCSATSSARRRRRRPSAASRSCGSPTRAAAKASSRWAPRRARSSGSTARAPRRSPSTPTPSRSTRTSSFRSTGSATTPTASSASTSSCRSRNKLKLADELEAFFADRDCRCRRHGGDGDERDRGDRAERAQELGATRSAGRGARPLTCRWPGWRERAGRTSPASCRARTRTRSSRSAGHAMRRVLEDASSARRSTTIFAGAAFAPVASACDAIHKRVLRSRVFVALHMHAGDGNVHTNIPVNSDDYGMLQEANAAVARIMALARALDGVDLRRARHRHHQARVPDRRRARAVRRLQAARRSGGPLQPRQADAAAGDAAADLTNAYTPSFSLIGAECLILEQSEIGDIADSIKDCLRCGKCKSPCATHSPRANLLYSPRNKILATSLLIEAFLYEEQTRRGVSLRHFDEFARRRRPLHRLPQVLNRRARSTSTSATCRSRCATCCARGQEALQPRHAASMFFLNATDPDDDQGSRSGDDRLRLPRAAPRRTTCSRKAWLARADARVRRRPPASTPCKAQVIHFINKPMPGNLPKRTARALLDIEDNDVRADHPRPADDQRRLRGGVLFPGLRLGAAVLAGRARHAGDALPTSARRRVLPPGYLCCGYPQTRRGRPRQGPGDHHRQPRAVPPRRQHAQLPRHQDRDRVVRHLHGPAAGLRVRARSSPAAGCSTSTST